MKKLLFAFTTLSLFVASAAENTYKFTLQSPAMINGTALKPGDYKVSVEGDKAILKMGKTVVEAPAKLETSDHKFVTTSVDLEGTDAKARISEIHVGGTKTKIVFGGAAAGQ
jgi:hypothetical protein